MRFLCPKIQINIHIRYVLPSPPPQNHIYEHFIDGCAPFARQSSSSSSLSCVSHNWYCNFKSLSHLTPTEYLFLEYFFFYENVQRVFTAHSYDIIIRIFTYVFLLFLLFFFWRHRRRLRLPFIRSINMRYSFDICCFLLLLFESTLWKFRVRSAILEKSFASAWTMSSFSPCQFTYME